MARDRSTARSSGSDQSSTYATRTTIKQCVDSLETAIKDITPQQVVSTGLDFIPVVGNIKSGIETLFGVDIITGTKLSKADRLIAASGIVGGGVSKGLIKGGKAGIELASSARKATKGTDNLPGRSGAFNHAKRDADIPRAQQPEKIERVPMRSADYEGGYVIKDSNGNVIMTREYHFTNNSGGKIIIQDHSAGHIKGGQGPHFNVRPADKPRTGKVEGTKEHYPFK
jgi:predicted ribonuclease toxin of YeeF-YezG toxin-antitoxin module